MIFKEDVICGKCRSGFVKWKGELDLFGIKVESLYVYNDFFSSVLVLYKDFFDEALADIFLKRNLKYLKRKYRKYILVCMPSHISKVQQRGFLHVEKMYACLNLKQETVLKKISTKEQKYLSREERKDVLFKIINIQAIINKKVLLVDDVMTTGESMKVAYNILRRYTKDVQCLTIAASKEFMKKGRNYEGKSKMVQRGKRFWFYLSRKW